MKSKKFGSLSVLFLSIAVSISVFGQNNKSAVTIPPNKIPKTITVTANSAPATTAKIESDMSEALTLIEDNYVNSGKLNYNEVFKSSIDGMLHTLDPHSNYFDAQEYEQFRNDQNSQYFGIGATIGDLRNPQGDVIATFIKSTFLNAPAYRAGLRYGDKIVDVNGTSMLGRDFTEVRGFLRGPRGTSARITVERALDAKREVFDIVRDAVPQPSIPEAYMIRPGIGYIAMLGGFNTTTYNEFREALANLKSQGMRDLILDLRGNGGGLVNQAEKIANVFLNKGQNIFTQVGRIEGFNEISRSTNSTPETAPLIILVNRNSASASEIFTGALQDHDRALVVGENTFGKALVTNPFLIEYGSMLLLTIAKYQTPSGRIIQRDYSSGSIYDYYNTGRDIDKPVVNSKTEQKKTDSGRVVYGGGGIMPDVVVKPDTIPIARARQQAKLNDPIFAFALDLVTGRVAGFENLKLVNPLVFDYDLKSSDYAVDDKMYAAFRTFALNKYKIPAALIDREKTYIARLLRTELTTAAYGTTTSQQVFNEYDNQLQKSLTLFPQARQLESQKPTTTAERGTLTNNP